MADAPLSTSNGEEAILLVNARLVDPDAGRETRGGVLVTNGVIADLGAHLSAESGPNSALVIDCRGQVVAPGIVDLQAFIGEPGAEHRETLASASRGAAAGGVTTLICRPDTDPVIDDPAIVDFVLRRARADSAVRIHPCAALTKGLAGREMTEIGLLKEAGAVAFGDAHRSVMNAQVMRRAMVYARDRDAIVSHFTQDANLAAEGVMNEGEFASRLGLPAIPKVAETIMLERDLALVRLTGVRYHAMLISCAESVEAVRRAKEEGLAVTCSVSVNHLTLNEGDVGNYRTFLKLSPPLRSEEDRLALVAGLAEGVIDAIVSDHDPQDVETKRQPFAESADGAIGLETMLAAALRLVHSGEIGLPRLMRALSAGPASVYRLPEASLRRGACADLIVFDPDEPWVVDPAKLASPCKNTPFDEARMQGRVLATLVGGKIVHAVAGSLRGL
ncbi:dihydroorotase [Rhizobiales bacterium GAS191]|nr:dihydroorotase [Rhizobiales bacterium GAS113]SEE21625.1 dihydroorotase [Rhizobiales bacterium GAS191]SEE34556.1 dihydroorotase [Rhizobiales bacterium GAS188]